MAPFAGKTALGIDEPAIDHQSAADTRAENGPEHDPVAPPGTGTGLSQRETVGVIGNQYGQSQQTGKFRAKLAPIDAGNVGAFDRLRLRVDNTGDRYGDAIRLSTRFGNDVTQCRYEGREIIERRDAAFERFDPVRRIGDCPLDRRSTNIRNRRSCVTTDDGFGRECSRQQSFVLIFLAGEQEPDRHAGLARPTGIETPQPSRKLPIDVLRKVQPLILKNRSSSASSGAIGGATCGSVGWISSSPGAKLSA